MRRNGGTGDKRKMGRTALAVENEFMATVVDDVVNVTWLGFQKDRPKNEPESNAVDGDLLG